MAAAAGWVQKVLHSYSRATAERPYRTNILTAGVLWFSGDVISQKADGRAWSDLDWRRTARITAYGLCVAGPVYCWWYSFLERKTAHLAQRSVWKYIAAKVAADQLIFEPPYLLLFFSLTSIMEGHTLHQIRSKLKQDYLSTFIVDCQVWPFAQVLNFRFVNPLYQSLVVNGVCVGWNAYLSFVKHKAILPPDHSEAAIGGGSVAAPARLSSPIPSGAPSSPVERSSSSS